MGMPPIELADKAVLIAVYSLLKVGVPASADESTLAVNTIDPSLIS
jgi:hypothetical protein